MKRRKYIRLSSAFSWKSLFDIVFLLDSVITAVGMVDRTEMMIAAVVVSIGFVVLFAKPIGEFIQKHPTVKMLALSFLLLIGVALIAEGFDRHIPKGYIYFATAFSVLVEVLNMKLRKPKTAPVHPHNAYNDKDEAEAIDTM